MELLSINVGLKRTVDYQGKTFQTGIFKQPLNSESVVNVYLDHIEGDEQADLVNHGGISKAVYGYSHEHYSYWQNLFGMDNLPFGSFGENFTFTNLDENEIAIGDIFQIGDVLLQVSQPRVPCFKLSMKFNRAEMAKLFSESLRTGLYFSVLKTGQVRVGDELKLIQASPKRITVEQLFKAYFHTEKQTALPLLTETLQIVGLSAEWKAQIQKYIARAD